MLLRRIATVLAVAAATLTVNAPLRATAAGTPQPNVVGPVPAAYTPDVTDGVVYAIGQSASTLVLGGSFTSIAPHGSSATVPAPGLAAFTSETGALVTTFAPTLNGTVNAVIAGPIPNTVYVGGSFTTIDGVSTKVALISTVTGEMVPGWTSPTLNGRVNALALSNGNLFVGGEFTTVAKTARVGLVALNSTTGAVANFAVPTFTGHHNYGRLCDPTTATCATAGTGIRALDINNSGTHLVAIGNFTSVSGAALDQIALLDVSATAATVDSSWATDAYTAPCDSGANDTYMRDVQFSPDGTYFVVVTTGAGGYGMSSDGNRSTCDAAARFETSATGTDVRPTWIDYTGNDTLLSVAITGDVVYVGGHERWLNNIIGVDHAQSGAVPRPGLAALDPLNGRPFSWNPGRNPRGAGASALLATADGLYVGSDTDYIGNRLYLRKKIAFFPLAGGEALPTNFTGALPGKVVLFGGTAGAGGAQEIPWDGTSTPGSATPLTGVDWTGTHGEFEVNNTVFYAAADSTFDERTFDGTTFGPAVQIDPYDDPTWDGVATGSGQTYQGARSNFYNELPWLTGDFYADGKIFYTLGSDPHMYWRWFTPESGIVGDARFTTTDTIDWSHVAGEFISGSNLYFADSTSKALFEVPFDGSEAVGTPTMVNNQINWASSGAFVAPSQSADQPPVAAFTSNCSGLTCTFDATGSSDPDGTVANYAWNWGDGTTTASTGSAATHIYSGPSTDSVTLTVTDNGGAGSTATHVISPALSNLPPVAVFTSSCTGLTCTFDATGSSDPDGTIANYAWSWGDGTTSASTGSTTNHAYTATGVDSVTLTVTDNTGSTNAVTHSVAPAAPNKPPVAAFTSSCAMLTCSFDATGSKDSDGTIATYAWSWGDGTTSASTGSTTSHTYSATGTDTVTLTVTDNVGATGSAAHPVSPTTVNQPPTASYTWSCTGLTCTVNAAKSHDPDGSIASYTWKWGDGKTSTSTTTTPTTSHTYKTVATYTVVLTVTDNLGATSDISHLVKPVAPTPAFRGATATDGSGKTLAARVPAATQKGDEMLLFASVSSKHAPDRPVGWTRVGMTSRGSFSSAVYRRSATGQDADRMVLLHLRSAAPANLTIASYEDAAHNVEASASRTDGSQRMHRSPAVSGLAKRSLALTCWSSTSRTLRVPAAIATKRSSASLRGQHSLSTLLADSGSAVSGSYGGLDAKSKSSGTGIAWTIGLAPD